MDVSLEIRKLPHSHVRELASKLETHDLWKNLMSIIPKTLEKTNYECDLTNQNQLKYISRHFSLIEDESKKSKRTCTEILFDEWGTSGRIRPALGHLLYLLTKAKLYGAADYVAINLLGQERPRRPDVGPEADITLDLDDILKEKDDDIEKLLDGANYVEEAVALIRTESNKTPKKDGNIPAIVITPDAEESIGPFQIPVVIQKVNEPEVVSDMMKFSTSKIQNNEVTELESQEIPVMLNMPQSESNPSSQEMNMPNLSLMMELNQITSNSDSSNERTDTISESYSQTTDHSNYSSKESYVPDFSEILGSTLQPDTGKKENVPNLQILKATVEDIQSSQFKSSENVLPDFNVLCQQSDEIGSSSNLPDLNILQINTLASQTTHSSNPSLEMSSKNRSCSSPLPDLSLVTNLPHHCYQHLEVSTNYFNEEKYEGNNFAGRLLGSGEFGTVYLALGLSNKPVAVKKLHIGDVDIVNIDDEVTKQFRNEVEVLSKYNHENLLSILGYSCDGSTYCLLYEYIPRGALRDILQETPDELSWKTRLNIAMGTSKAISYLHTAFSTPLIHRDIKSANILLDSNNQPKLCDFGLIKLIPNQNINTATTVFGTSAYMPREAFGGDISVKLDTFSFGVVLLELLTSLPPLVKDRADLVTHIIGNTVNRDDISHVVDYKAGSWLENQINYALNLYKIAYACLEEKHRRPTMLQVKMLLLELIQHIKEW